MTKALGLFLLLYINCAIAAQSVPKPLRLYLTYYPTVEFAGICLALDKGWYKDAGIDLSIDFKDLAITDKILNDEADIAMHSGHEIIRQVSKGNMVKAFAAEYQFNPLSLAANPKYKNLEDLRQKTIGYFTEQEKDYLRVMFASVGVGLDELNFKLVPTFRVDDLISLFKSKQFDAIPVWEFNHPVSFALKGYNVTQFASYKSGFHFYGSVFFAKPKTIHTRSEELAKFIAITRRGWLAALANPTKTVTDLMKKWYPKNQYINGDFELTKRQQQIQLMLSKRYLFEGVGEQGFGSMTKFQWQASLSIAEKYRLIPKNSVKLDQIQTQEVLNIYQKRYK